MKELSIAGKATRYDEALKEAVIAHKDEDRHLKATLERIFPELKESEDERIRKELIQCFSDLEDQENEWYGSLTPKKIVAWLEKQGKIVEYYEDKLDRCACENFNKGYKKALEKQGEQMLTDKVEPKFKQGDWVVYENRVGLIIKILQKHYIISFNGVEEQVSFIFNDRITKWTIQDAKDGDVLYNAEHNYILVYKHQTGTNDFVSYCRLCLNTYTFYPCEEFEWDDLIWNPSTKEQREQLKKAMAEDGYEWDADKKELKKMEQPFAWSEEDEKIYNRIYDIVHAAAFANYDVDEDGKECGEYAKITEWFKSLKEKVQLQSKQEWSEEDERIYKSIIYSFAHNYPLTAQQQEFVKSLKNRVGCETNCTTTNAWDEDSV